MHRIDHRLGQGERDVTYTHSYQGSVGLFPQVRLYAVAHFGKKVAILEFLKMRIDFLHFNLSFVCS